MARKKYVKPQRRKRCARTLDSKYKSMQSCWRHATDKQGTLTIAEAKRIVDEGVTCPYCGLAVQAMDLSIDHVIPRSRGGSSDPANLAWSHAKCNLTKSDLTGDEYLGLLHWLDGQDLRVKESVLGRLRAGSYMKFRRKRG